jgi:hypothetical protein
VAEEGGECRVGVLWVVVGGLGAGPEGESQDGERPGAGEESKIYCLAGKTWSRVGRELVLIGKIRGVGWRDETP